MIPWSSNQLNNMGLQYYSKSILHLLITFELYNVKQDTVQDLNLGGSNCTHVTNSTKWPCSHWMLLIVTK